MKTFKTKYFVFALIAAILVSFTALSLTGCPPGEEEEEGPVHDIDKALYGSWENSAGSLTVTFSADGITWGGTAGKSYGSLPVDKWIAKDGKITAEYQGNANTVWNYALNGSGELVLTSPASPNISHTLVKKGGTGTGTGEGEGEEDFAIAGEYHFLNGATGTLCNWEFKANKTFTIVYTKPGSTQTRTGKYTVSGNGVSLDLDSYSGLDTPAQEYTASRQGKETTLALKNSSDLSSYIINGIFLMNSRSITLTEGKSSGDSEEKTDSASGYKYVVTLDGNVKITEGDNSIIYANPASLITDWVSSPSQINGENAYIANISLTLPSTIEGRPVTVLGENVFHSNEFLEKPSVLRYGYFGNIGGKYKIDGKLINSLHISKLIMPGIKKIEPGNLEAALTSCEVPNIVIGAGVEIVDDYPNDNYAFNGSFTWFYNQNGKQAGSYTAVLPYDTNNWSRAALP